MPLSGAALARLLPQQGAMCLLDAVVHHDHRSIVCVSARHVDPSNPLTVDGRLSPLAGIEFAAQAIAAHGALADATAGRRVRGWLARVRDCVVQCERMDDLPAPLVIEAECIAASASALSYRFSLRAGEAMVLSGSALVALIGDEPA
jgi:predicted hotdog family 3-hydroxylacyl-ACP dehydratase